MRAFICGSDSIVMESPMRELCIASIIPDMNNITCCSLAPGPNVEIITADARKKNAVDKNHIIALNHG